LNYLLYLSYGHGIHELEVRYSLLSARQALQAGRDQCRLMVYTDDAQADFGRDVSIRFVGQEEMLAWSRPDGYQHRRKLCALRDALTTLDGPVVLMDGDTYFRKSPMRLFGRIGPGRSLMHRKEGHLDKWNARPFADYLAGRPTPLDTRGQPWHCTVDTPMWNSGVIGMHPKDAALTTEMLHLIDQLLLPVKFHATDQFCTGTVLMERTKLAECRDIVHHYWDMKQRVPFRAEMTAAFKQIADEQELHRHLSRLQPVENMQEVWRLRLKRMLESAGLYRERRRA
jgi:hypothetical protein